MPRIEFQIITNPEKKVSILQAKTKQGFVLLGKFNNPEKAREYIAKTQIFTSKITR